MLDLKIKFKKNTYLQPEEVEKTESLKKQEPIRITPEIPDGLFRKCNFCKSTIVAGEVKKAFYICPKCGEYFRLPAYRRIGMLADPDSFEEWDRKMEETNPLQFKGYEEKLKGMKEKTGLNEAVVTGRLTINGSPAVIGVCDGRFMMASMGQIVGEKITRAIERATEERLPIILFTCSGGARMQEGIVSLMQMAKTSAALKKHSDAGLLYITVLTDPTTGGVTASFAMLGDIILAEPGALVGFAGPRVIEQTIGQKLPKGFQRAEFLLEHGFVDRIIERKNLKKELSQILKSHSGEILKLERTEFSEMQNSRNRIDTDVKLTAWNRIQISRQPERPVGSDYIHALFENFIEFHGDRYCKDDPAIVGGIAEFKGIPVTVIAQEKGKNTKDNMKRNFGMPSPDGYRKALRLMKQAEKFKRPIICFVDTPGAFCGMEAEERGQGEAIARNLYEMSALKTPVLSIFIGEGGSGGALAMAVANEVWMMENAVYSILSPEGFASILWKDAKLAPEAAEVMKLTSSDLLNLGIIEKVIPEETTLTEELLKEKAPYLKDAVSDFLIKYQDMSPEAIAEQRYNRFRKF